MVVRQALCFSDRQNLRTYHVLDFVEDFGLLGLSERQYPLAVAALYLTFTQAEKSEILNKVKDVVVNDLAIYADKFQAVTAFTRHRKTLTYFTVAPSADALTSFIEKAITGSQEVIVNNNADMKASNVGKPSLVKMLQSVGLRAGGDLHIPTMTDDFYKGLSLAGRLPSFKNFRLPALIGTGLLTSVTAYYYRGPLTQWRLGDIGSTAPYPPGQLMTLAYLRVLTASRSLASSFYAIISNSWLPLLLSTGVCLTLGLCCGRRKKEAEAASLTPAALIYLSTLRKSRPSSPPSATLLLGYREVESIQVYGRPPTNKEPENSETEQKWSTPQQNSSNTSKDSRPKTHQASTPQQEQKEPSQSTASAQSPGPKKSKGKETTPSPPQTKPTRIGGPVQDLNVQRVSRLQSINTKLAIVPYKVGAIIDDLLASLKRNRVRFVSSEELLQSVDHVTNAFAPELPSPLPYPKVVAPRAVHKRSGSIANLQHWYDMAFPSAIDVDYSQDADLVQNSDIKIATENITLDTDRANYMAPLFDSLRPTLRTMMLAMDPEAVQTLGLARATAPDGRMLLQLQFWSFSIFSFLKLELGSQNFEHAV
ncbi:hypothetical protein ACLKA6_011347 [Drosophila palustris]